MKFILAMAADPKTVRGAALVTILWVGFEATLGDPLLALDMVPDVMQVIGALLCLKSGAERIKGDDVK